MRLRKTKTPSVYAGGARAAAANQQLGNAEFSARFGIFSRADFPRL